MLRLPPLAKGGRGPSSTEDDGVDIWCFWVDCRSRARSFDHLV